MKKYIIKKYIIKKAFHAISRIFYKHNQEDNKYKNNGLISHVTYYAVGNVGDTVLSQCVRKTFEYYYSKKCWNLINLKTKVNDAMIEKINHSEALVIGGGGLFLPDSNGNSLSGWQWAISADYLNKIKVPVIIYSVGYNYFRGQTSNKLFEDNLRLLISKASFVGLRNRGSVNKVREFLNDDELKKKVLFQPCTTTIIRKIYSEIPSKINSNKVAFNVAFDREDYRFGKNKTVILNQIAEAAKEIEVKGYEIYYVAHCDSDLEFCRYLDDKNIKYKCINISMWYPDRVISFYNQMEVVIGMRGHSQMIPFGLNCKIITLCSHDKMKWFLEDIGAEDWCVELNGAYHAISNQIINIFEDIEERHKEETTNRLIEMQEKLWSITCDNLRLIDENIKIRTNI